VLSNNEKIKNCGLVCLEVTSGAAAGMGGSGNGSRSGQGDTGMKRRENEL